MGLDLVRECRGNYEVRMTHEREKDSIGQSLYISNSHTINGTFQTETIGELSGAPPICRWLLLFDSVSNNHYLPGVGVAVGTGPKRRKGMD